MNDRGAMKVVCVVGTRPNFMKIAPIILEMTRAQSDAQALLVHTGQHYNDNMSDVFFRELEIRQPDVNLDVRSSSHSRQTAEIMFYESDRLGRSSASLIAGRSRPEQ